MMARRTRTLWRTTWDRHAWFGLAMIVAIVGIVIAGSWPIYGKPTILLAGSAAAATGIGLGIFFARRRVAAWLAALLVYVLYVVVALLSAVPWVYSTLPASALEGLMQVVLGPVMSWKSLLTIAIPVGDFGDTQLPLFITVYLASMLAAWFLLDTRRKWQHALVPLAVALLFPTVFGSSVAPETFRLGPFAIPAHLHQVGGLVGFGALLGWPVLRGRSEHQHRVKAAQAQDGDHSAKIAGEGLAKLRMRLVAAAMVLAAIAAGALATIPIADWRSRAVPRSGIENTVELPELGSPLAAYRVNFTPESLDAVLLSIDGEIPRRVRFATLGVYDGIAFRASDRDRATGQATQFERVPYRVADVTGRLSEATVVIDGYAGEWMPIASEFSQAEFSGDDQLELASGFYFNKSTQTAIEKAVRPTGTGLRKGDSYRLVYAETDILDEDAEGAATLTPSTAAAVIKPSEDDLPNLYRWLKEKQAGPGNVEEVRRLRDLLIERSYLGRSKAEPVGDTTWMPKGYVFRSSDAGQTIARIDGLFENMLDPRYQTCAAPTDKCAAHVGDEEQYAAATALLARTLGFPSRIVYGANVPVDGSVTGRNATVWTEIQVSDGRWVALAATPRVDNAFIEQPEENSYKQYNPATNQENAKVVAPPAKEPSTIGNEDEEEEEEVAEDNPYLPYVVLGAKIFGVAMLVTLPVWGILLAKLIRRRRRRRRGQNGDKVLGGWQEYLDRLVDSGDTIDYAATRNEIAASRTESAQALAIGADFAAFSGKNLTDEQVENYWNRVLDENKAVLAEQKFHRRVRTRLSPKSFGRYRRRKHEQSMSRRRFRLRAGKEKVKK